MASSEYVDVDIDVDVEWRRNFVAWKFIFNSQLQTTRKQTNDKNENHRQQ